jgi:hypothetical protein
VRDAARDGGAKVRDVGKGELGVWVRVRVRLFSWQAENEGVRI